jgi:hypothetical protein
LTLTARPKTMRAHVAGGIMRTAVIVIAILLGSVAAAQSPFDPGALKTRPAPAAAPAPAAEDMPDILKRAIERTALSPERTYKFTQVWSSSFTGIRDIACEGTVQYAPPSGAPSRRAGQDWPVALTGDTGCANMMRGQLRNIRSKYERGDGVVLALFDPTTDFAPPYTVRSDARRHIVESRLAANVKTDRVARSVVENSRRSVEIDKASGRIVRVHEWLDVTAAALGGLVNVQAQDVVLDYGPVDGVCCVLTQMTARQTTAMRDKTQVMTLTQRTTALAPAAP